MSGRYCLNCGHEAHDGPLYKEVMDGDNKPIRIEICKHCRVENDSYSFIDKVLQAAPDADHTFHDFHQVNMFGDIENNDSIVGVTQPGNDYIYTTDFSSKDLTDTLTITTVDSGTVTIRDPQWEVSTTVDGIMYDATEPAYKSVTVNAGYGLDFNYLGNKAKAFRKEVQAFCNDIKRLSPAGSASFELAKDFMDKHYGEEG